MKHTHRMKVRIQVGFVLALLASCGTAPQPPQALPLDLCLLGGGIGDTKDAAIPVLFKRLKEAGAFDSYVDASGTRVPIRGMSISVAGDQSDLDWSAPSELSFLLWKVWDGSGNVSLLPYMAIDTTFVKKELVAITLKGARIARLTPKYEWAIDPEFYMTPPGVIQDLYVTDFASVTSYSESAVRVGATGQYESVGVGLKSASASGALFNRQYKNSILGTWRTGLPSQVLQSVTRQCDFSQGANCNLDIPGGAAVQFHILDCDMGAQTVDFRVGSRRFDKVRVGAFRLLNDFVSVRLVSLDDPAKPGGTRQLTIQLSAVDRDAASKISVTVKIKPPEVEEGGATKPPLPNVQGPGISVTGDRIIVGNNNVQYNVSDDGFPYSRSTENSLLDSPVPRKPRVLFLSPKEHYGALHLEGLERALAGSGIEIVLACRSSHHDLLPGRYDPQKLAELQECVRRELNCGDVIAVVGPCLVEETRPLVDAVVNVNPLIPIVLESPIRRVDLGSSKVDAFGPIKPGYPVYRISSGIDERGPQLGRLLDAMMTSGINVVLAQEDSSYGESLADAIREHSPSVYGKVAKWVLKQHEPVTLPASVAEAEAILFLGIGSQFSRLVAASSDQVILGLMNSWVFPSIMKDDPNALSRLVDMEDVDSVDSSIMSVARSNFVGLGYEANAIFRDQMFSYDAGICVAEAWKEAQALVGRSTRPTYRDVLVTMIKVIERSDGFGGASGRITFPRGGGQNPALREGFAFVAPCARDGRIELRSLTSDLVVKELTARLKNK